MLIRAILSIILLSAPVALAQRAAFFGILSQSAGGGGTVTYLSSASAGATSQIATTGAISTTGATLIVCAVCDFAGGTTVLTNSTSTSCTLKRTEDSGNARLKIYECVSPTTSASHTFTADGSSVASYPSVAVVAYSGTKTTSPFDQQNGTTGASGTSKATGSVTPTTNGQVLVTALCVDNGTTNYTVDGGFTRRQQVNFSAGVHQGMAIGDLIQTTATAANPTWSWNTSSGSGVGIGTWKAQ